MKPKNKGWRQMLEGDRPVLVMAICWYLLWQTIWYPEMPLIWDEMSYIRRALGLLQGTWHPTLPQAFGLPAFSLAVTPYPPGNAFLLAGLMLFDKQDLFLSGIACLTASTVLIWMMLERMQRPARVALLALCYPPALVLSRTVMSEMPSLLLVSLFFFLYFRDRFAVRTALALGFLAGLGQAFRETTILLLLPFLVEHVIRERRLFWPVVAGLAAGLAFRVLPYWFFEGSPFFVNQPDRFGLDFVPANLPLYLFVLLVFFPGGFLWLLRYRGAGRLAMRWAVWSFVGLHLCYEYNGIAYSGIWKALILSPRYFIPMLPLVCLATASGLAVFPARWRKSCNTLLLGAALLAIVAGSWLHHAILRDHWAVVQELQRNYHDKPLFYDYNSNMNRYINPLLPPLRTADSGILRDSAQLQRLVQENDTLYLALSLRFENAEKRALADRSLTLVQDIGRSHQTLPHREWNTRDGAVVRVYAILPH